MERIKSDTSEWVEYTKAVEECSWRNSAKWPCNVWIRGAMVNQSIKEEGTATVYQKHRTLLNIIMMYKVW